MHYVYEHSIMWFQEISIPSQRKLIGNSKGWEWGEEDMKQNWNLQSVEVGRGGFIPKNVLWEHYGY